MGLMAGQAAQLDRDFVLFRVKQVRGWVILYGMADAVLQRQARDLAEVVLGQLHFAVEDGDEVRALVPDRLGIGAMALQAQSVAFGAEQMIVVTAMSLVTGRAALHEGGLMKVRFFHLVLLFAVATQTNVHRIRFRQARVGAGVRAVAVGTIAGCSGMLHLRGLDQLRLVVVAGDAEILYVRLRQDYFPILRRSMADFALLVGKRGMRELCHQLGCRRLVRIVAAQAVRRAEGLVLVRLLQGGILRIMTIHAERRGGFGQVELIFGSEIRASFVRRVAGFTAHIERGVAAALGGNIRALGVAGEAEIVFLVAGGRLEQLILVGRSVGIVTGQAIANRWRVNVSLDLGCIFVAVAGKAELIRSGGDQLDAGSVFGDADFVTAQAAGGDGGGHGPALGL